MAGQTYKPGEIVVRGEALYREDIQQLVGTVKKDSFVVIDVESEDYEVDASDAAATRRLLDRRPDAVTYAICVGNRVAYSYAGDSVSPEPAFRGVESADRQVLRSVEVVDAEGRLCRVQVLLDTEFTGCLMLTAETVQQMGLSSAGRRTLKSAKGEWSESEAYLATASWHGHLADVLLLESDSTPLVGMALLWGSRVTLEPGTQGAPQIEVPNLVPSTETPPIKTGLLGRLWGWVKRSASLLIATIVGMVALVAFALGVGSLPLDFGAIITFLGIWLAIGVMFGQNKPPTMPLKRYIERRLIGVFCCYALFVVIAVVYTWHGEGESEAVGSWELFGLFVLSLVGFAIGFLAGQDKEPQQ